MSALALPRRQAETQAGAAGSHWRTPAVGLALLAAASLFLRVWCGARGLDDERFWDERYSLANVAALLDGSPHPANAFYPGLSYLPQAAVLAAVDGVRRATGNPALEVRSARIPSKQHFTPLAYFLCRALQAGFGTWSLVALFVLGRRHATAAAGLFAALIMSAVVWHIRQSAVFKPDILLVLTLVLALDWSIRALRDLRPRDFACAGLWIGACAAAKYSGVIAGLPLVLIAGARAASSRDWAGYGKRLALAAAMAAAVFAVTNPFAILDPAFLRHDFGLTLEHYDELAKRLEASRLAMPGNAVGSLLSATFHGPVVGVLALAGLAAWVWRLLRLGRRGAERTAAETAEMLRLAVLGSFAAAYVAAYSAVTSGPSEHNWLPLVPVTSLAAANLIVRWKARLVTPPGAGAWRVAVAALVLYLAFASFSYARTLATPSTWNLAEARLRSALRPRLADRIVYVEESAAAELKLAEGRRMAALAFFDGAERLPDGTLDTGDAEVLVGSREAHAARCHAGGRPPPPGRCVEVAPSLLRVRGTALTLVLHPWEPVGEPLALAREGPRCSFRLAGLPSGAATSGSIEVVVDKDQAVLPDRVGVGGQPLPLLEAGRAHGSRYFSTPRFALRRGGEIWVRLHPYPCQIQEVLLLEWR